MIIFAGTQEEAAEAYDVAAIKFRGLSAVTNFDMSRYDVKSILDSSTLPIGGAAKRLKEIDQQVEQQQQQQQLSVVQSTDHGIMSLSDGININNYQQHGWLNNALTFQQPQPCASIHYPYGQKLWCKQEQDSDHHVSHTFQDTHNFFQSNSGLQSFMSLDNSASMDNSSGSYGGDHGNGYGGGGGYMIPMGATSTTSVIGNDDVDQSQRSNGFGESYESVYGTSTTDPYHAIHARNLYYQQQQTCVDQAPTWVPTAIPARPTNMVLYQYDQ